MEVLMGMLQEFREFAVKGNAVDMAVGIITGAAFGKIVSSIVEDVVMPPIGVLLGGVNFVDLKITLKHAAGEMPTVTLNWGKFLQTCIDFAIVAWAVFLLVKLINSLKKQEAAPPPAPPAEELLLGEIRDLLKKGR
jgi:large conductance mechanosensitive channel